MAGNKILKFKKVTPGFDSPIFREENATFRMEKSEKLKKRPRFS